MAHSSVRKFLFVCEPQLGGYVLCGRASSSVLTTAAFAGAIQPAGRRRGVGGVVRRLGLLAVARVPGGSRHAALAGPSGCSGPAAAAACCRVRSAMCVAAVLRGLPPSAAVPNPSDDVCGQRPSMHDARACAGAAMMMRVTPCC